MDTLAQIEVSQPGHASYYVSVAHWPVRVGRSLDNEVVLNDPHVAAYHLSMIGSSPEGVSLQVLETSNGVRVGHKHYARQSHFHVPHGPACVEIVVGRTVLRVRTSFHLLEPEQPIHSLFPVNTTKMGVTALVLATGMHLVLRYMATTETSHFWHRLPEVLFGFPLLYMGWAGIWALLCRLFAQPFYFWRSVFLICSVDLIIQAIDFVMRFVGFTFSWEWLEPWAEIPVGVLLTWLIFKHLSLIAPARRRLLRVICGMLYALGLGISIQQQYTRSNQFTGKLYASALFPASMEVVKPVSLDVFSSEVESELPSKLKEDLQRKNIDSGLDADD